MCIRDSRQGAEGGDRRHERRDGACAVRLDVYKRQLLRGLHYSRYAILREVVENEFADEGPEEKREAFVLKLLPLVGNVFSVFDLSDDNFALSSD